MYQHRTHAGVSASEVWPFPPARNCLLHLGLTLLLSFREWHISRFRRLLCNVAHERNAPPGWPAHRAAAPCSSRGSKACPEQHQRTSGKAPVLEQSFDVEVFNANDPIAGGQSCRQLVEHIISHAGDLIVQSSDLAA